MEKWKTGAGERKRTEKNRKNRKEQKQKRTETEKNGRFLWKSRWMYDRITKKEDKP